MDLDFNAILSNDGHAVIADFGIYHLTGDELGNPANAIANAEAKCRAAYDSGWLMRRHWLEKLTAATKLETNQDVSR